MAKKYKITIEQANKFILAYEQGKEKELEPSGNILKYAEKIRGIPLTLDGCHKLIGELRKRLKNEMVQ